MALDVALSDQQLLAATLDLEVAVRRPAGVGTRLDRAEVVLPGQAGEEPAESLEVLVLLVLLPVAVVGVQVDALGVALPNLHERIANRVPFVVEDLAREVRHLAD